MALVIGPTRPTAGIPYLSWNAFTEAKVIGPKNEVTGPMYTPFEASFFCNSATSLFFIPLLKFVLNKKLSTPNTCPEDASCFVVLGISVAVEDTEILDIFLEPEEVPPPPPACSGAGFIIKIKSLLTSSPLLAVMVTVPGDKALTNPVESTVATLVSLDSQVCVALNESPN